MKNKLNFFIKKIEKNKYIVKDSYILIDFYPLVCYLVDFFNNTQTYLDLLDVKPEILIITNILVPDFRYEKINNANISFCYVKAESKSQILDKIKEKKYSAIIINSRKDEYISFEDIARAIKSETMLFISESSQDILRFL